MPKTIDINHSGIGHRRVHLDPGDESSLCQIWSPKCYSIRWRPTVHLSRVQNFMKQWQIEHRVSSPQHPQSNGMAEKYVQTMKASLIKTMEEGEDIDLALLTYKATPLSHNLPSPAELLNSRKYKTLLSTCIVPTRL